MCNFWSAVITKQGKVFWSKENSSHEVILKAAGLKDDKLADRDFVRVEIAPMSKALLFSKREEDWAFKVDEEGTLPSWFSGRRKFYENKCWLELEGGKK